MPEPQSHAPPAENAASTAPAKGRRLGTIGIVGVVMVVEGVGLFAAMKLFGSEPDPAGADVLEASTTMPVVEDEEIELVKLRALNVKSGRPVLYSIKVYVRARSDRAETLRGLIERKKATIEDAIARIIRSAEPPHLAEDGLETLRRQVRFELGRIANDEEIIEQVLIPECTPFPTGF